MTKDEKAKDPYSLEGVPKLGPAGIKALAEEGFTNTLQVIHKNPTWFRDVTGMTLDDSNIAFNFMKNNLRKTGILNPQQQTASEILVEREKVKRIPTGCKAIDHILRGGIELGYVTELYGENGAGKTQTAHAFCINVQRPVKDGGLAEPGKPAPMILYIATENTFRPERIISMLAARKIITQFPATLKKKILENKMMTVEEIKEKQSIEKKQKEEAEPYLQNIIVNRVTDAGQQMNLIKNAIDMVQHVPIKLIILDSGIAHFRSDFIGRGNIKTKFDALNEMMHDLTAIAEINKVAVLFLNQIYNSPDPNSRMGEHPDIPSGGNIIGHGCPYILMLEKSGSRYRMTIMKSPYQAQDEARFEMTEEGLSDIE
jgi:DNA repair protein RadA